MPVPRGGRFLACRVRGFLFPFAVESERRRPAFSGGEFSLNSPPPPRPARCGLRAGSDRAGGASVRSPSVADAADNAPRHVRRARQRRSGGRCLHRPHRVAPPVADRNDHSDYPVLLALGGASMLGSEHGDFRFVPEFLPSLSPE